MLDWHNPLDVQRRGIELAKSIDDISEFIFPQQPNYNKNVWESCAKILNDKSDAELSTHLEKLLEWIQDLNWPGAIIILVRLKRFSEMSALVPAVARAVKKAIAPKDPIWLEEQDEIWLRSLAQLLVNGKLRMTLPKDVLETLEKHYYDNQGYDEKIAEELLEA